MPAYSIVYAYHEELPHWSHLTESQRGLLLAFTFCLKLRLEGTDPSKLLGPSSRDKPKKETQL